MRIYAEQDRPGSLNQMAGYKLFGGVIYPWYLLPSPSARSSYQSSSSPWQIRRP